MSTVIFLILVVFIINNNIFSVLLNYYFNLFKIMFEIVLIIWRSDT